MEDWMRGIFTPTPTPEPAPVQDDRPDVSDTFALKEYAGKRLANRHEPPGGEYTRLLGQKDVLTSADIVKAQAMLMPPPPMKPFRLTDGDL
jgi:hypothetical protein